MWVFLQALIMILLLAGGAKLVAIADSRSSSPADEVFVAAFGHTDYVLIEDGIAAALLAMVGLMSLYAWHRRRSGRPLSTKWKSRRMMCQAILCGLVCLVLSVEFIGEATIFSSELHQPFDMVRIHARKFAYLDTGGLCLWCAVLGSIFWGMRPEEQTV